MKKLNLIIALLLIICFTIINLNNQVNAETEPTTKVEVNVLNSNETSITVKESIKTVSKINELLVNTTLITTINIKPEYNIALDAEIQEYMYQKAIENDLSYEFLLALAYCESGFNTKAVSPKNKNGTTDSGIMQINSAMTKKIGSELGYKLDKTNPEHSIDAAVWLLTYLRDKFSYLQMSSEEESFFMTLAYNMGESNAISFIKRNGFNGSSYVNKIFEHKEKLEQFGSF